MTKQSDATGSLGLYTSVWKVLAGERGDTDLTDRPGLSISWADSAFPFWNAVFLTDTQTEPEVLADRLGGAAAYMRARRQPGLVYVCVEHLSQAARDGLSGVVLDHGLAFALRVTGMSGTFTAFAEPTHPELHFARVADETQLLDYADINAEGYGMQLEAARAGLRGSRFWLDTAHAYLGYAGDRAVAAASVVVHGDCLYLALVATRPSAQRRGYAEATVRKALYEAHKTTGLRRTGLHATDAGAPVYRRVGYQKTATFLAYGLA